MSTTREKLAVVEDGRAHAMGIGEPEITIVRPTWERFPRQPEKDTDKAYAFETGLGKYRLISKETVDKAKNI